MMVIKTGRYGKFLACPGYPECKNTKPIIEEVGADCPECGNPLIYRKTKTGKKYVACSHYPDCNVFLLEHSDKRKLSEMRTVYRNCTGEKRKILEMQQ